jgi:flagellar hook protein FlgE
LGVDGRGFLVVDSSGSTREDELPEFAMKTTGSFQTDAEDYLHDESGNYLMRIPTKPDGAREPFSLLEHLERVRLPLAPSERLVTKNAWFKGTLPADDVTTDTVKSNAVNVYDSLGVIHQLNFEWQYMAPRVWKLTIEDSEGAVLKQGGIGGISWDDGVIVGFQEDGDYAGTTTTNTQYQAWHRSRQITQGAQAAVGQIQSIINSEPQTSAQELDQQITKFINVTFPEGQSRSCPAACRGGALATQRGAAQDSPEATDSYLQQGKTYHTKVLDSAETIALTALQASFKPDSQPPAVFAEHWQNNLGDLLGASPSTINLDISKFRAGGNQFAIQPPTQDGASSSAFTGISVDSDGIMSLNFVSQPPRLCG